MKRLYQDLILKDVTKKMVFIGGPRQVGKTTICKAIGTIMAPNSAFQYFNWDVDDDRWTITRKLWLQSATLIIFDELHKYKRWKQWIKGVYDSKPENQQYLVTGSARLDTYKKGGDSLMGRYHYWRLHPLTLDELPQNITPAEGFIRLMNLGGFPEPFLQNDEREARRWRKERFSRILREDIRDLQEIRDIKLLELFVDALRRNAGQLIVLSNLAQDLQISPTTAKNWITLIENMYIGFSVYPLIKNIPRSLHKPFKFYFFDNADTQNEYAIRLENLVATTLLKRLHYLEDYYGYDCQLHYIRDKDGREVDFATVVDGKLYELIEVKSSDKDISSSLKYYSALLTPKHTVQIVGNIGNGYSKNNITIISPIEYFLNINPITNLEV